jgi:4-O-beta-D-mannosyl-D-glucose phosphorylase
VSYWFVKNEELFSVNGIYSRFKYPVLTRDHAPLHWRFDFNPQTNPFFYGTHWDKRYVYSGAIKWNGKYLLVVRVEGNDR